jgi:molybdopterin synthase sulfur carrier subunit
VRIRVRFFASIREALGAETALELEAGATVGAARLALMARDGLHATALASDRALRAAVNHELCEASLVLNDGDELAFFPPVTGG